MWRRGDVGFYIKQHYVVLNLCRTIDGRIIVKNAMEREKEEEKKAKSV